MGLKKTYQGFIYLLKLKTIYDQKQKGTTYSYRFISNWCDVSKNTAAKVIRYLKHKSYIKVIKKTPKGKADILDIDRS